MGQKCILLRFIKAVNLIDKDQGRTSAWSETRCLSPINGFANLLNTAQNGRDRDEMHMEGIRQQARQRGFPDPWRAP